MITLETFLFGLLAVSVLTSLTTEAIKKFLAEREKKYYANTLAGLVAMVLSVGIGGGYVMYFGIEFTIQVILAILALIFMSWLCAMIGYDKVIQTIKQLKTTGKE